MCSSDREAELANEVYYLEGEVDRLQDELADKDAEIEDLKDRLLDISYLARP